MYTDDPYDGDIYSTSRAMSGSHGGVTAIGSNTPPRRHDDVSEERLMNKKKRTSTSSSIERKLLEGSETIL
jgi:hypothetical protein